MSDNGLSYEVDTKINDDDQYYESRKPVPVSFDMMTFELPDASKEPSVYEPSMKEPSLYEPTTKDTPPAPPTRNDHSQSASNIRRKQRASRRNLMASATPTPAQDNLKNPPREMPESIQTSSNSSTPVEPSRSSETEMDPVREAKWTGEAEEESTIARRKAIQEIMKDTSLSAAERNQKIQQLMSGKIVIDPTPSTRTGETNDNVSKSMRKNVEAVNIGGASASFNSSGKNRNNLDTKPGFTAVKGTDTRADMKARREMVPMSPGDQRIGNMDSQSGSDSKVGFTAVRGEDSRVKGKVSRGMAPISPGISQLQTAEDSKDNQSGDVRPGVTAVRGEDARISRKANRGSTTVTLPSDLVAAPQFDNDEPTRAGGQVSMDRSGAIDAENSFPPHRFLAHHPCWDATHEFPASCNQA
ncbi:hypothetical protein MHU86_17345 [Fragilaria crotonensis]|nr:hypothetical protein MHU86_17345 [Fragilaria crotonensis]